MKKYAKYALLAAFPFLLNSCSDDGDEETNPQQQTCTVVTVSEHITTPTTWTAGNVYHITNDINIKAVLTIQPGVVIKSDNIHIHVLASGKIIAKGNAENRITFTAYTDDSVCGDSNGDGDATAPEKGSWIGITLASDLEQEFTYCDFFYAGANIGGFSYAIQLSQSGAGFNFDNCKFAHTRSVGNNAFAFYGGYHMADPSVFQFTNNAFYDNDRPLYLDSSYTVSTTNIFHNPENPQEKNKRNCIWMWHTSVQNVNTIWGVTEVPYVLDQYDQGNLGSSLTIADNVVVKFANASSGLKTSYAREVTLSNSAIMTSLKDDAHGGDTNGDGNTSTPQAGDWYGFYDADEGVFITGSNILYAGS